MSADMLNKFHSVDLSKRKFLVTGGAGFIGSHLVDYLVQHRAKKVIVLDNLSTGSFQNIEHHQNNSSFEFVNDDINNSQMLEGICSNVDYVFHQAALGSVPRSIKTPLDTHHANATGFLSVLEACRNSNVKKLVYASSSSVYGDSDELPKKEENIGNPKSPYAITKLMDEKYAKLYSQLHGLDVVGLRYFNIFGPRQNPTGPYAAAIPLFILAALEGKSPKVYGDGEQSRDFTYVLNAVQANIKAMFSDDADSGEVYNIACGKQYSLNFILESISEILDVKINSEYLDSRVGDVLHSLASISRANRFGYEPIVEMKAGLEKTIEWYKKEMTIQNSSSSPIGQ